MRLVYTATQQPVQIGDTAILDGQRYTVEAFRQPHKPDSSGKVTLQREGTIGAGGFEVYVSVIGAEWIEREDQSGR